MVAGSSLVNVITTGQLPFREGIAAAIAGRLGEPPRLEQYVDGVAPALATIVQDPSARRGYLELARAYIVLAKAEEASSPKRKAVARNSALSSNLPRHRSVTRAACRALIIQH